MHLTPVSTRDATRYDLPPWAEGQPDPDPVLDLGIYPSDADDQLAFAAFRATEHWVSRASLILAASLFLWMLIGIAIAHHAGRI